MNICNYTHACEIDIYIYILQMLQVYIYIYIYMRNNIGSID